MNTRTKSLGITIAVKEEVAERDSFGGYPCCLVCGRPAPTYNRLAFSNAHFISRAQGGLGIEQNILTLCPQCHTRYDSTEERPILRAFFKRYLQEQYPDWDEEQLTYRKD